ncbi:MAG: SH3 domain-containing protein [Chloroflexi bacterium]|nr:SH3 domain-containing protein [Chloroflexota bacterium]
MSSGTSKRALLILLSCVFLFSVLAVSAQATPTPINVGENKTGEVTDASSAVAYAVAVGAPQSISVQVLAITPGFAPTFQVIDPGGIMILDTANPGTLTIAQGTPSLSSAGSYTIEVKSANGTTGQFLISVQAGAPLAPPTALTPGQPVNDTVNTQATRKAYSFSGSPTDVLALIVHSSTPNSGPVVKISDADSGETLGLNSTRLLGVDYRIPAAPGNYLVEVTHSGASGDEGFSICLATESGSIPCPGLNSGLGAPQPTVISELPSPTPTLVFATATLGPTPTFSPVNIDPNGACQVASAHGPSINVRGGPGTNFNIVTQLAPNTTGMVIGRLPDNSWFQVNVGGVLGWVSATVVVLGGNCAGVSVVNLPTAVPPTQAPTNQPTTEPTTQPTDNPTAAPTSNGTPHLHFPPIAAVTLIAPIQVVPVNPKLDYQASANYGEANLSNGFSPDPYSVGMTTGGNVNVSYLGGSCSGFATSHPDLRINFGGGGASLLRIYFVGSNGDAAMVVNDPYGNFYCVDDSFGTVNPTIDFNNPAGGSYDVWIASYANNANISGTLYITENSGNHP